MTYCRKATGPNAGNALPLQAARRGTSRLSRIGLSRIGLSRIGLSRIGRPASVRLSRIGRKVASNIYSLPVPK